MVASSEKKQLTSSLAIRVFVISLILLVFPLLFHNLFLYYHEYKQTLKNLFVTLQLAGESRVFLLQEEMQLELYKIQDNIDFNQEISSDVLAKIARREKFPILLYFSISPEKKIQCVADSTEKKIKDDFSFFPPFLQAIKQENSCFLTDQFACEECLYITQTLYEKDGMTPKGLLVAGFFVKGFLQDLTKKEDIPEIEELSLFDPTGRVFVSTRDSFVGKNIHQIKGEDTSKFSSGWLSLSQADSGEESYFLQTEGQKYFAVKIPLKQSDCFLLLDVSKGEVDKTHINRYLWQSLSFFGFLILIGGFLAIFVTRKIAKPMENLYETMEKVSAGSLQARYVPTKMGFEINILGNYFNQMIDSVILHQHEAEVEKLHKQSLLREFQIGQDIQKSLLPEEQKLPSLEISSGYLAAKEVGGDFYDTFLTKDYLALTIADAAGKGIGACLYSLGCKSMIRSFSLEASSPSEVLYKTNNLFCLDTKDSGVFVTAFLGFFDEHSKLFYYSNAGHYPVLLRKKTGEILDLTTKGMALGVEQGTLYETKSVILSSGDLLVFYTDGVIEEKNQEEKIFGVQRLKEFLQHMTGDRSAKFMVDKLFEEVRHFSYGIFPYDDMTLMVIKIL
jgi:sigma-B regulation protein RsbU (phosphoserine phosphatase)